MRRWLPVLALFAGLGSLISCKSQTPIAVKPAGQLKQPAADAQPSLSPTVVTTDANTPADAQAEKMTPFDKYLAGEKKHAHDAAIVRFSAECGLDVTGTPPRYAQRSGDSWNVVPDFSKALMDQDTDFYGTVAVWHTADRILVEKWGMELDTGDFYRLLYCLQNRKIASAESTSWRMAGYGESSSEADWGYEHRCKLSSTNKLATVMRRYVDLDGAPMAAPKLDDETGKGLGEEAVPQRTWADLGLPKELLQ